MQVVEAKAFGAAGREFLSAIPHEFARRHLVLSAGEEGGREVLRVADLSARAAVHNVSVRLGRGVLLVLDEAEALAAAIDTAYARGSAPDAREIPSIELSTLGAGQSEADAAAELARTLQDAERDLLSTSGKGPVTRLVDLILFEALRRHASDVHLQPRRDGTLVRMRLDGVLHTVRELSPGLTPAVVARVKVMGRMDLAEQRAPQDGRATVTLGREGQRDHAIDLRISTLPTTYGERVVLRLLDAARSPHLKTLGGLGMPEGVEAKFLGQASRTSGVVLVTGPTGSGKTTTLYATLAWISARGSGPGRGSAGGVGRGSCPYNIMTIEDPVEYDLSSGHALTISQTQVDPKKNVTFATGLRHVLRQDPDVIMVGEIRDEDTARIAVQASLTGHLVLSTLHTNDAPSAVARLLDLGVEPFLVSSSLNAVLAQRLVRTLHGGCAGAGCEECLHTGFRGRTGVFELLVVDDAARGLISERAGAAVLHGCAVRAGMTPLSEAGAALVREGRTSAEEVARVIHAGSEEVLA
jgi:general secretion pathway protein E